MTPAPKPTKQKKARHNGIKVTVADKWFSLCIRERADWTCERCGRKFPEEYSSEGLPKAQGLDCSHFKGRGNWSVRHDPFNAFSHCRGCHGVFEANPDYFVDWAKERLGSCYDILIEKSKNIMFGKQAHHEIEEIARHYEQEFKRMRSERAEGKQGRIEFQGYF